MSWIFPAILLVLCGMNCIFSVTSPDDEAVRVSSFMGWLMVAVMIIWIKVAFLP